MSWTARRGRASRRAPKRRGAVDIARATTRDAPGGADNARVPRAGATPGPGEHWPDDEAAAGKKETGRGFAFPATGHASAGGALDAALRGGATPGPGEHWPEDGESRSHESRAPGFTMPKSSRDKSSRTSLPPGPGNSTRRRTSGASRSAAGANPDAARRTWPRLPVDPPPAARSTPGTDPGRESTTPTWCLTMRASPLPRRRACAGASPPTSARAARLAGPRSGRVRGVARAHDGRRDDAEAPRRSGLVARDAALRPGPADYEPDDDAPHPMTVAGLCDAGWRAGAGAAPEDAAAARGAAEARAAARRLRSPLGPASASTRPGRARSRTGARA